MRIDDDTQFLTTPNTYRQNYTANNSVEFDLNGTTTHRFNVMERMNMTKRFASTSHNRRFKRINNMYGSIISNKKSDASILYEPSDYQLTQVRNKFNLVHLDNDGQYHSG